MSGKEVTKEKSIDLRKYVQEAGERVETILRIAKPQFDGIAMVGNRIIKKLSCDEFGLDNITFDIQKLFKNLYDFFPTAQALLGWRKTLQQDIVYLNTCIKNANPATFSLGNSPAAYLRDDLVECLGNVNKFLNSFGNSVSIFLSNCTAKEGLLDKVKSVLSVEARGMVNQLMLEERIKPGLFSDNPVLAELVVTIYESQQQDKSESKCAIN